MGAALTYARRYALFTLVGIAGEDDLAAPDLNGALPRLTRKLTRWLIHHRGVVKRVYKGAPRRRLGFRQ
jgi:hypothetical protein